MRFRSQSKICCSRYMFLQMVVLTNARQRRSKWERFRIGNSGKKNRSAANLVFIERAAALLDDPEYGLKLGTSHGARDNGLVGFIALNSPTLRDALALGYLVEAVT